MYKDAFSVSFFFFLALNQLYVTLGHALLGQQMQKVKLINLPTYLLALFGQECRVNFAIPKYLQCLDGIV